MKEFNQSINRLNDVSLAELESLFQTLQDSHRYHASVFSISQFLVFKLLLQWPLQNRFPAIDLLRLLALHPDGAQQLASNWEIVSPVIVSALDTAAPIACQMLALRALANAFKFSVLRILARDLLYSTLLAPMAAHIPFYCKQSDQFLLSVATLLHNCAADLKDMPHLDPSAVYSPALQLLQQLMLTERPRSAVLCDAIFRLLVAIGTSAVLRHSFSPELLSSELVPVLHTIQANWASPPDLHARLQPLCHDLIQFCNVPKASSLQQNLPTQVAMMRCEICNLLFESNAEVMQHAKQTGHTQFGELTI